MTNRLAIGLFVVAATLWAAPVAAEGMLRVTVGSSFNTLDPAKSTLGEEYIYVHLVFNGRELGGERRPQDLDLQAAPRGQIP